MKDYEYIYVNGQFEKRQIVVNEELSSDEILVKILNVGICGSDLFMMELVNHSDELLRLGHEWIGIVEKSNSEKFSVGDRVTSSAILGCGKCKSCSQGDSNLCLNSIVLGAKDIGAFRTRMKMHAAHLVNISALEARASVLYEVTAVADEIFAQAVNIGLYKATKVLVFGGGPIGFLTSYLLKEKDIEHTLVEICDYRFNLAKKCNLPVVKTGQALLTSEFSESFDFIVDCSGDGNRRSGLWKYLNFFCAVNVKVLIVAKYKANPVINSNIMAKKNATIKWIRGMSNDRIIKSIEFWKFFIDELEKNLITHEYSIDEIEDAFSRAFFRDNCMKIVINV